ACTCLKTCMLFNYSRAHSSFTGQQPTCWYFPSRSTFFKQQSHLSNLNDVKTLLEDNLNIFGRADKDNADKAPQGLKENNTAGGERRVVDLYLNFALIYYLMHPSCIRGWSFALIVLASQVVYSLTKLPHAIHKNHGTKQIILDEIVNCFPAG
ncbi:hypothetical protein ACJX0J_041047, partial [Zea mays]